MQPLNNKYKLDDLPLEKFKAISIINKVMETVENINESPLNKTASTIDSSSLVDLFLKMIACLNIDIDKNSVNNILQSLSNKNMDKYATQTKNSKERKDEIKIASKSIKDSHYQIDISKDIIDKDGKKLFMVSCYARDAYLGRYLIKRNYFYMPDRESSADEAYDEIVTKMSAIKNRYYNGVIDVPEVSTQFRKVLDGVVSEIRITEDNIATNINR